MEINQFGNSRFSSNDRQANDFLMRVQSLLGEGGSEPLRILDVGCGDGGKVVRLAECWPQAHCTGLDISGPNIHQAELRRLASPARSRLQFVTGDYLTLSLGPSDIILADSVLHLIAGSTDKLFAKLAEELKPGGLLLCTMPSTCLYNTALFTLRRALRLVRSDLLDRVILRLACWIHGRSHSVEFLRERLHYMYIIPHRLGSPMLVKALRTRHQLILQTVQPCPHPSSGQPRHQLWCFRKLPSGQIPYFERTVSGDSLTYEAINLQEVEG